MKYDVWFCKCGRIHLMNFDLFDWIQEDSSKRSVVRVCQNCGSTMQVSLDTYEDGWAVCKNELYDKEFVGDCNTHIILNEGIAVPTISGYYADRRGYAGSWYVIDDNYTQRTEVDAKKLINNIWYDYPEDAEDILKSISGYVSGIDWSGTIYER